MISFPLCITIELQLRLWNLFILEFGVDHFSPSITPFHSNLNRPLSVIYQWAVYSSNLVKIICVDVIVDCSIKVSKEEISKLKKQKQTRLKKTNQPTNNPENNK